MVPPHPGTGHSATGSRGGVALVSPRATMALASSSGTSSRRPRTRFQMTYPHPGSFRLFHDVHPYERPRSTISPSQPSVGQGPSTSRSPCRSFD